MRARTRQGFTVPELLTGLLILGIVVAAAADYTQLALRHYRNTASMLERIQLESLARNAVIQEIGFAGYGGDFLGEFGGYTIEVGLGRNADTADTFRIHYLEERWLESPVERHITFDVARDSGGTWNLYRREEGGTRQPAVQDVTNLKVLGFVDQDGELVMPWAAWPEEVTAMIVQLSFSWGSQRAAYIPFISAQRLGWL